MTQPPALHREWTRAASPVGLPPVVLINSLGTSLDLWDPITQDLAGNRDVLRYDARGHGLSSDTGEGYSLDELVDDLVRVLDEEKVATAHVVGISIGGMTAIGLAQRYPTGRYRSCRRAARPAWRGRSGLSVHVWCVRVASSRSSTP